MVLTGMFNTVCLLLFLLEWNCSVPGYSRRFPVGVEMCVLLCQNTSTCNAPVYLQSRLTCYLQGEQHTHLVGAITLHVRQNLTTRNPSKPLQHIYTRTRGLQHVPCTPRLPVRTRVLMVNGSGLSSFSVEDHSCTRLPGSPHLIAAGPDTGRLYWMSGTWYGTVGVSPSYADISHRQVLYRGPRKERITSLAVDEMNGLLFFTVIPRPERLVTLTVNSGETVSLVLSLRIIQTSCAVPEHRLLFFGASPMGRGPTLIKCNYTGAVLNKATVRCYRMTSLTYDFTGKLVYFTCSNHAWSVTPLSFLLKRFRELKSTSILLLSGDFIIVLGKSVDIYDRSFNYRGNATCGAQWPSSAAVLLSDIR